MSDKDLVDLFREDLVYIRGKMDDVASVCSNSAAKIDNHLTDHSKTPGRITILISVVVVILSITVASCAALKVYVNNEHTIHDATESKAVPPSK